MKKNIFLVMTTFSSGDCLNFLGKVPFAIKDLDEEEALKNRGRELLQIVEESQDGLGTRELKQVEEEGERFGFLKREVGANGPRPLIDLTEEYAAAVPRQLGACHSSQAVNHRSTEEQQGSDIVKSSEMPSTSETDALIPPQTQNQSDTTVAQGDWSATGDQNKSIVLQNAAAAVPPLSLMQTEPKIPDVAEVDTNGENDPATSAIVLLNADVETIAGNDPATDDSDCDDECGICFELLTENLEEFPITELSCGGKHIFHTQCISDYQKLSLKCPMCREPCGLEGSVWSCNRCTMKNMLDRNECEVCDTKRPAAEWPCAVCTFINLSGAPNCAMCSGPRPES